MTMLSCSEAIEQLGGSALTSSVSSVAAAVEIEVCARNTFSRLAQGGRTGADGRSCDLFHGDRYLAGRLVAWHDRHREERVSGGTTDEKWAAHPESLARLSHSMAPLSHCS